MSDPNELADYASTLLADADEIRRASDADAAAVITRRLLDAAHEKIDGSMPMAATMIVGIAAFVASMARVGKDGLFKHVDDAEFQFASLVSVICTSALIKMKGRGGSTLQ